MPRLKLTRVVFYLFLISFVCFIAFNVLVETNKRRLIKKKDDLLPNEAIRRALIGPQKEESVSDEDDTISYDLDSLIKSFKKRPWFMSRGSIRPEAGTFPYHNLAIWPDEAPLEDRIVSQLMYIPRNYKKTSEKQKLKKILLYFGRGGWTANDLPTGQAKFLMDKCPVNTCEISLDPNDGEAADAIFFKVSPSHR